MIVIKNRCCFMLDKSIVVTLSAILASSIAIGVRAESEQNRLRNTLTGANKCLDIVNDGQNNQLTMTTCANVAGQRWTITANQNNPQNYRLQTPFAGAEKCLEVINDDRKDRLVMSPCNDSPGQIWNISDNRTNPGYTGYSRLRSQIAGADKCLDIVNDGRNNKLTMAQCAKIAGQNWRITRTQTP